MVAVRWPHGSNTRCSSPLDMYSTVLKQSVSGFIWASVMPIDSAIAQQLRSCCQKNQRYPCKRREMQKPRRRESTGLLGSDELQLTRTCAETFSPCPITYAQRFTVVMSILRSNHNAGSFLIEAIDTGAIQKFLVRERKIGHFEVDHGKQLFLIAARSSRSGWCATLGRPLLQKLAELNRKDDAQRDLFRRIYFWIACGSECCELRPQEWKQIIEAGDTSTEQKIRLKRPPNCSFRVRGFAGKLSHTVPRKRFPSLAVPA